jgi:hypothetical protein
VPFSVLFLSLFPLFRPNTTTTRPDPVIRLQLRKALRKALLVCCSSPHFDVLDVSLLFLFWCTSRWSRLLRLSGSLFPRSHFLFAVFHFFVAFPSRLPNTIDKFRTSIPLNALARLSHFPLRSFPPSSTRYTQTSPRSLYTPGLSVLFFIPQPNWTSHAVSFVLVCSVCLWP